MSLGVAELPLKRTPPALYEAEERTGTEPITEEELGYWIRANPRRQSLGIASPVEVLREQITCLIHQNVSATRSASTNLCMKALVKMVQDYCHDVVAAPGEPSDSDLSEGILANLGNQMSTIGSKARNWMNVSLARAPRAQGSEWRSLYAKLDTFSRLEDGWNSYSAVRPTTLAIDSAREFLDVLCAANMKPKRIGPSAVGGVGVTFRGGERKSYVEFLNAGKIYVLFSDGVGEPQINGMSGGYLDYMRLIGDIRKYLNA